MEQFWSGVHDMLEVYSQSVSGPFSPLAENMKGLKIYVDETTGALFVTYSYR